MTNQIHNHYEERPEVSIEIGDGIVVRIKGYSADDAIKIAKSLPANSEEKSEGSDGGLMPTIEYSQINYSTILESRLDNVGGYGSWKKGDKGVVAEFVLDHGGLEIRKIPSSSSEKASTLFFMKIEVIEDFYAIIDGIRYKIVEL